MDWVAWHDAYDDPRSSLSQRLEAVRSRVGDALDTPSGPTPRILSLCPGDGRDLLPVLAARTLTAAEVTLVEQNPELAQAARRAAAALHLERVAVRTTDAARTAEYTDVLPVDLLMLCGIFGNISDADIHTTVTAAAAMTAPGGRVIWTRGAFKPDLRPVIRHWFVEAGMEEISFDGESEPFGVGVAQVPDASFQSRPASHALPERLFTFLR